ncbi:hypothetical protein ZYGR_0AK05230 [Zygosaccharomyces rouxii]|uniref:Uncharacterized protein n=1 Tax=Zygosaccharomyces rouxii TaxID=4956 RepID=A0A1Q3AEC7_ZYGRO|nr:hypothetical protein ZYGR_0AK05230 [Zygosaccharomyces rouxii]
MDSTFFFSNTYNPSIDTWSQTHVNSLKRSRANGLVLSVQIHDDFSQELDNAITECMEFCQLTPGKNALNSIEKIRSAFMLKDEQHHNQLKNLELELLQLTREKQFLRRELAKVSSQLEVVDEMVAHNVDLEWANEALTQRLTRLENNSIKAAKAKPELLNAFALQDLNFGNL